MAKNIIGNTDDIYICSNEFLNRFPINRCIKKLCDNDISLYEKYSELNGVNVIKEYSEDDTYQIGDIVWFRSTENKLYLMRRVVKDEPNPSDSIQMAIDSKSEYVNGVPYFEKYGWEDLNSGINIEKLKLKDRVNRVIVNAVSQHQNDDDMHPIGMLQNDYQQIQKKLMLKDLSNVESDRTTVFFPFQTFKMTADDVILDGYYRIWDCGLLEMDFTYRLGYAGYDEDTGMDVLTCNNVVFSFIDNADNQKYFNSTVDSYIFNVENTSEQNYSQIDNTIQRNRNNYVNTYFANIKFPEMYFTQNGLKSRIILANNNYMLFSSDIMSQDRNTKNNSINIGANSMTYGNRSQNGFTAIYVTYPDDQHFDSDSIKKNYNAVNGGLVSNSFNCHLVGKWSYL